MVSSAPANLSTDYREDIQGLRAIGALLVAVFHIWLDGISGGVDVFFVVSGYFLAQSYLREYPRKRQFWAREHYARFLTRVAPPALITLVLVMILGFYLTTPVAQFELLRDVAFSALYLENWWLIERGHDYFAQNQTQSLTQHFWAVSLIGQVYLIWPIVVLGSAILSRGLGSEHHRILVFALATLSAASFAWSAYHTIENPARAYFDSMTRFWEFGVGALLGLCQDRLPRPGRVWAALLSWIGTALVISCGFAIGAALQFPGFAAIWPVSAAALILIAGRPGDWINAGSVLGWTPIAKLGGLAFGIYLIHWPILAVVWEANRWERPGLAGGMIIIVGSVALAVWLRMAAQYLVQSVRAALGNRIVPFALAAALIGLSLVTEGAFRFLSPNAASRELVRLEENSTLLRPGPFTVRKDVPKSYDDDCHTWTRQPGFRHCVYEASEVWRTVVLVGDSHAAHWLPALRSVGEREGLRIISVTKGWCPFADPEDERIFRRRHESCKDWNVEAMGLILDLQPDLVFTVLNRARRPNGLLVEQIDQGIMDNLESLNSEGIAVVGLRDTPRFDIEVPACVFSPWMRDPNTCGSARSDVLNDRDFAQLTETLPENVRVVDMTDQFCTQDWCDVVRNGLLMYMDATHLTRTYSGTLGDVLWERAMQPEQSGTSS